jgi:DNA helicase HerA-like ATPase
MKIGHIISATPTEFIATLDPEQAVGLYEFVAIDGVEPTPEGPKPVRVLGQIVKIYRDPYQLKRDLPLYSVVEQVAQDLLEVQAAKVKVLGYLSDGEVHTPKMPPRVGSPVYLAEDREVEELYGRGELCVGKLMPRGIDACLDLEGLKRHVAVIAATGSGKTWFSVVLIEELLKQGAEC